MNRRRLRAWALTVSLLAAMGACRGGSDPHEASEDRLLEGLMESYVSGRFAFYPAESTLAGLLTNDHRLGTFAQRDIEGRVSWLSDFRYRLMGLRLNALSRSGYMDALWLSTLAKAELFELEERARWRRTASFYTEAISMGLVALVAADDLSSRTESLIDRLEGVSGLAEQARENLGLTHELFHLDGLESLSRCQALVLAVPLLVADRVDVASAARIGDASRVAAAELERLRADLPRLQTVSESVESAGLGRDALMRYLRHRHMTEWTFEELSERALLAVELESNELSELSLALESPPSLEEAPRVEETFDLVEQVTEAEVRARAFVDEHFSFGAPVDATPVRMVPSYFPGRDPVELFRLNALEPDRGSFLMVRALPVAALEELDLSALRAIGHRQQNREQANFASLLRRVASTSSTSLAWRSSLEREAVRAGYGERGKVELVHHHRNLLAALRLVAVLRFHGDLSSLDDIAVLYRDRGHLSEEAAAREARRAAMDPSAADAGIGQLLLSDFTAEYLRRHPLSDRHALRERLLRSGPLPIRLLRFDYLEPTPAPALTEGGLGPVLP